MLDAQLPPERRQGGEGVKGGREESRAEKGV